MRCTYRSIGFVASALVHLAGVAALLPPMLGAGPPVEVETRVALSLAMFRPPAPPAPVEPEPPVEAPVEPEAEPEPVVVQPPPPPPLEPEVVEPPPRPRPVSTPKPAPKPPAEPPPKPAPPRVAQRPPPTEPRVRATVPESAAPARPAPASSARNPGPARSSVRDEYLQALIQRIHRKKYYPRQARRRREEGEVLITFVIQRSGELSDLRISRSSGHDSLDQAALKTLKKISPFRGLPPELGVERWELAVPIAYSLSR